jgi:hypothetical protein
MMDDKKKNTSKSKNRQLLASPVGLLRRVLLCPDSLTQDQFT